MTTASDASNGRALARRTTVLGLVFVLVASMVATLGGAVVLAGPVAAAAGPTVQIAASLVDPLNRSNTLTIGVTDTAIVCTDTNTPVPPPFFVQAKTTDQPAYIVGQPITHTIVVTNDGPSDAQGVAVTDAPTDASIVSVNPSTGSFDQSTNTWTIATLAAGANATVTIVATVTGTDASDQACIGTNCSAVVGLMATMPIPLAFTGTDAAPDLGIAVVLLILGGLCLLAGALISGRRRSRAIS